MYIFGFVGGKQFLHFYVGLCSFMYILHRIFFYFREPRSSIFIYIFYVVSVYICILYILGSIKLAFA